MGTGIPLRGDPACPLASRLEPIQRMLRPSSCLGGHWNFLPTFPAQPAFRQLTGITLMDETTGATH